MNKISHFKDKIQLRHVRPQLTLVLALKLYWQQQKANVWALVCWFGLMFLRYHIYNMLQSTILTAEIFLVHRKLCTQDNYNPLLYPNPSLWLNWKCLSVRRRQSKELQLWKTNFVLKIDYISITPCISVSDEFTSSVKMELMPQEEPRRKLDWTMHRAVWSPKTLYRALDWFKNRGLRNSRARF